MLLATGLLVERPGLAGATSARGEESAALIRAPEFVWGLNLPGRPVSRRLTRWFKLQGPSPVVLGELQGPGCIRRFWVAGKNIGREVVLRIYFDGQRVPGVEAPLPDFFGVMHNLAGPGEPYPINTPFLEVKPKNGFTANFPMPFARSARVEVVGGGTQNNQFYYMIDWHEYPGQELKEPMRFCARWRREAPVRDSQDDFIILDADGPGRLVGFAYGVDMLQSRQVMRWSHAGGDRIYIDGEGDEPAYLRGLGGEDTFGVSYGGNEYKAQSDLFADMPYYVQKDAQGDKQKLAAYRFFVHDAIYFRQSIHMRFGARTHDVAATVYWYSARPVRPFFTMPPVDQRMPGSEIRRGEYDLPLPDSGQWWITGPFALDFKGPLPAMGDFDPGQPFQNRPWQKVAALRGFVEFNHFFRPPPGNANSPTLEGVAVARCTLETARATKATFTLAWDDQLVLQVNDRAPLDLGTQPYLRARTIAVPLAKGQNVVALWLSNTEGLTRGAWNFSFRCKTARGEILLPQAEGQPSPRTAQRAGAEFRGLIEHGGKNQGEPSL
jgi:hypothetical protein